MKVNKWAKHLQIGIAIYMKYVIMFKWDSKPLRQQPQVLKQESLEKSYLCRKLEPLAVKVDIWELQFAEVAAFLDLDRNGMQESRYAQPDFSTWVGRLAQRIFFLFFKKFFIRHQWNKDTTVFSDFEIIMKCFRKLMMKIRKNYIRVFIEGTYSSIKMKIEF